MKTATPNKGSVQLFTNAQDIGLERLSKHDKKGYILTVGDREIILNARHAISTAASLTDENLIAKSLLGGHYVIGDFTDKRGFTTTHLMDYRDASYKGFIHSQSAIDEFVEDGYLNDRLVDCFKVDGLGLGSDFQISSGFSWNAFSKNLKSQVNIIRQICTNGLMLSQPMFEREVPVINRHEEHLDIAARQMMNGATKVVSERLHKMANEHARVRDVKLAHSHFKSRAADYDSAAELNQRLLINLERINDLTKHYTTESLDNGLANELPAPISRLDLYNMITESNSHSDETSASTTNALNGVALDLMFKAPAVMPQTNVVEKSPFSNPEQAFFS